MRGRPGSGIAERPPEAANGGADFVERRNEKCCALLRALYGRQNWGIVLEAGCSLHGTMGRQREFVSGKGGSLMPRGRSIRWRGIYGRSCGGKVGPIRSPFDAWIRRGGRKYGHHQAG